MCERDRPIPEEELVHGFEDPESTCKLICGFMLIYRVRALSARAAVTLVHKHKEPSCLSCGSFTMTTGNKGRNSTQNDREQEHR